MKLDDRHQMVAIYLQSEEVVKINLAKLIEKRAYETAISRHQYFRLIIKSIRIKLRKQRFYANHSLPHQRFYANRSLPLQDENVSTDQDECQKISKTTFLGFNSPKKKQRKSCHNFFCNGSNQKVQTYIIVLISRYRTLFLYKPDPMPSFFRHTLRSRIQNLNLF